MSGISNQTDFGYTGQRNMFSIGLMDYNARFYDPALGRFIQPDTITPDNNPQHINKYTYVLNNPINKTDPTGHCGIDTIGSFDIGNTIANCVSSTVNAAKAWNAGNHDIAALAVDFSGLKKVVKDMSEEVAALNADTASVFSDAPLEERLPHAIHLSLFAVGVAASVVAAPVAGGTAAAEKALVGETKMLGTVNRGVPSLPASSDAGNGQRILDSIIKKHFGNVNFTAQPIFNSNMSLRVAGKAMKNKITGEIFTEIGPRAIIEGERETVITLAHEEMHQRLWARGWEQSEAYVENIAQRFAQMIFGQ